MQSDTKHWVCVNAGFQPAERSAAGSGSDSVPPLSRGRGRPWSPTAATPLPGWPPWKRFGGEPGRATSRT